MTSPANVRALLFLRHPMRFLFFILLTSVCGQAFAASWTATLQDGSVLRVDPDSQRAMRYFDGGVVPLWDGTHELEDGSVVIVHDGQAVPTESMIRRWEAEPGSEPALSTRYCDQLVRKVCGFDDECAQARACVLARQLSRMEREQQRRAPLSAGSRPHMPSSGECQDALSISAFPACSISVPPARETACKQLVDRVCGSSGECQSATACDPARQLLEMESEERLQSADPDAGTATGAQCREAMDNPFFEPCR